MSANTVGNVKIVRYGDINTHMELSETSRLAKAKHDEAMMRMEVEKVSRQMAVPVDVREIYLRLRLLGEPITIFGETAPDRRDRLRHILARLSLEGNLEQFNKQFELPKPAAPVLPGADQPAFRIEGPPELSYHRFIIAQDSLARSAARLSSERARKQSLALDSHPAHVLTGRSDASLRPRPRTPAAPTRARTYARARCCPACPSRSHRSLTRAPSQASPSARRTKMFSRRPPGRAP